jgi:hypothetical protein
MTMMPNFITVDLESGEERLNMTSIPVSILTKEEAEAFAIEMGKAFIKHWEAEVSKKGNGTAFIAH